MLDALSKADGGFFFEATEATDTDSLRQIGAQLGAYTKASMPPRPADWREVLDAVLALGQDRPVTVSIAEFPYLVKANPELPSVIQAAFGPRREERLRSRTRLLLCGSPMSFMGRLLSGTAPLRGRAGLEMVVPTLDYHLAVQFWMIDDPHLAVLLYSIVGGTPAYRDGVAGGRGPRSVTDLDRWVPENVLSRFSPLFREARYLLAEEPDIEETPSTIPFSAPSPRATAHPRRHRRLPGAQGHRHLPSPVGPRRRRPARPRRRRLPARPQRLPDQRAADCLLPRDHAA